MCLLEEKTEQDVVDWWEAQGEIQIKLNIMGRRGWPDRIFFVPGGKPVFIEFKRVKEKARKLQAYIHKQLREKGYDVYIADTAEQGKAILASARVSEGRR